MSEDFQTLLNENYPLIINEVKKYSNNYHLKEDLIQEAIIALYKASKKYSPEPGHKFSTYAIFWIRGAIFNYLRKNTLIYTPPKVEKKSLILFDDFDMQSTLHKDFPFASEQTDFFLYEQKKLLKVYLKT